MWRDIYIYIYIFKLRYFRTVDLNLSPLASNVSMLKLRLLIAHKTFGLSIIITSITVRETWSYYSGFRMPSTVTASRLLTQC